MKQTRITKRITAVIVILMMVIGILPAEKTYGTSVGNFNAAQKGMTAKAATVPANPVYDSATDTTTWSYVYFGSYPQSKVTGGDLTAAITGASYDSNGDTTVNGVKYRRMKKSDATYSSTSSSYYDWTTGGDADGYHYFKYEPIKWRVLNNDGTDLFLLADQGLDDQPYHETYNHVTWETSTIRSWLNGYGASANQSGIDYSNGINSMGKNFINTAFTSAEQAAIANTTVVNDNNPYYGTAGGNDTTDKIFLLSIDEVTNETYGFSSDYSKYSKSRRMKTSDYGHAMGTYTSTSTEYFGNTCWWLRSPGVYPNDAAHVDLDGYVHRSGNYVRNYDDSVCPALKIHLSSDLWSSDINNLPSDGSMDDMEFIEEHINFIGSTKYNQCLNFCDTSSIMLRDYKELKETFDIWRLVRGDIWDNPYDVVLADLIISEQSATTQIDAFELNLYSKQRIIINGLMDLIEGKVNLTPSEKNKLQKLFETKDFSDDETFKLCEEVLGTLMDSNQIETFFQAYDTSSKFMSLLGDGKNIVNGIIDIVNYSSILNAYIETSDEFQLVLMKVYYYSASDNVLLASAISNYLTISNQMDIRDEIIKQVANKSITIGIDLFESSIIKKVKTYIISHMDLSDATSLAASKILSFIEGMKIGYDIGVTLDNILFNTDKVTDSYVIAYATANFATYLKDVLKDCEANLLSNQTIQSAKLFCEAFGMYRKAEINVVDKMVQYFSANQQALISKIFEDTTYEVAIYEWLVFKCSWQSIHCHSKDTVQNNVEYSSLDKTMLMVACPTNVEIFASNGDKVLEIIDNQALTYDSNICATVRNNIKYIIIPSIKDYTIKITATDSGSMTYSVHEYNATNELQKVTVYDNIKLEEKQEFEGTITAETEKDYALISNGEIVRSDNKVATVENMVSVTKIQLQQNEVTLKKGETTTLTASILPEDATLKTVTWYSSDENVATVTETGEITAIEEGTAVITCLAQDGSGIKATCNISCKKEDSTEAPTVTEVPTTSPVPPTQAPTASPVPPTKAPTASPIPPTKAPTASPAPPIKAPTTTPKPIPAKGKTYTVGNYKYIVTKSTAKNGTVALKAPKNNSLSKVSIPATVKINNYTFKVTAIAAKAFQSNKKLKTVTIGSNIITIGDHAFAGCTALTKVTVGKDVTTLGKNVFSGDKKLKNIVIQSEKLKKVGTKTFSNIHAKAIIKVPKKKLKAYQTLLKRKGQKKTVKIR